MWSMASVVNGGLGKIGGAKFREFTRCRRRRMKCKRSLETKIKDAYLSAQVVKLIFGVFSLAFLTYVPFPGYEKKRHNLSQLGLLASLWIRPAQISLRIGGCRL